MISQFGFRKQVSNELRGPEALLPQEEEKAFASEPQLTRNELTLPQSASHRSTEAWNAKGMGHSEPR